GLGVADITMYESVAGVRCDIAQIVQVSGIPEGVEVHYQVRIILFQQKPQEVRADKAGAARYQDPHPHGFLSPFRHTSAAPFRFRRESQTTGLSPIAAASQPARRCPPPDRSK